jgi:glutamyl-tRNA synthetase
MDDTDYDRSEEKFEKEIIKDLNWLGLSWDDIFHQKDRIARYDEIKKFLLEEGRLYPCYETPEELEIKRKILLSQGLPPVYDRAALELTSKEILEYEREGKRPHFRFKLDYKDIIWQDLVQGEVKMNAKSFSDPIVIRANGTWTYLLCSVVDDIDFGITHIIRGEDHISNSMAQTQFFESLKASIPTFAHLARISSKTEKISKRIGGFDIKTLREEKEIEAMTINSFLGLIGTSKDVEAFKNLEALISNFNIDDFNKSPVNYDEEDLVRLNHKIISGYSFSEVKDRLIQMNMTKMTEEIWGIIRGNISKISEAKYWYDVCCGDIDLPEFSSQDREFLTAAYKLLPKDDNWNEATWGEWTKDIKSETGRAGKELFIPLRLALTGVESGPELKIILPIIGKEKTKKRLIG